VHLPPYFLEIAALLFAITGAGFAWLTRWHLLMAVTAASALLFVVQCLVHILDARTAPLIAANGPITFYALMSLWGMVPAVTGAALARLFKRWRNR
jgi:hypothetical protein